MSTKVAIQTILSKPFGHLRKNWLTIKGFSDLKEGPRMDWNLV